jgi:hypothetical protein
MFPSNSDRPFGFHGTGTLLFYRNRPLLVTAAHVVDDASEGLAVVLPHDGKMISRKVSADDAPIEIWEYVLVSGGDVRVLPNLFENTPIPEGKTRADDLIDVAAMELTGDFTTRITFGPIG